MCGGAESPSKTTESEAMTTDTNYTAWLKANDLDDDPMAREAYDNTRTLAKASGTSGIKIETYTSVLPGSDDRIVRAYIPRNVALYGGLWFEWRVGNGSNADYPAGKLISWDCHSHADILPADVMDDMRAKAARCAGVAR